MVINQEHTTQNIILMNENEKLFGKHWNQHQTQL